MRVPRIKVCGVTRERDLDVLAECGVDAVGFNFVPTSPRALALGQARRLSDHAAELGLLRVAVVMDLAPEGLDEVIEQVDTDWIQLHGREPPSVLAHCRGLPILKATSWTGRLTELELVQAWRQLAETNPEAGAQPAAWLVDAYAPGAGGGTGKIARWDLLRPRPVEFQRRPMILAGGLTPENVREAIELTEADGVDTASGVESEPGIKDPYRVALFASNALAVLGTPR